MLSTQKWAKNIYRKYCISKISILTTNYVILLEIPILKIIIHKICIIVLQVSKNKIITTKTSALINKINLLNSSILFSWKTYINGCQKKSINKRCFSVGLKYVLHIVCILYTHDITLVENIKIHEKAHFKIDRIQAVSFIFGNRMIYYTQMFLGKY